MTVITYMYYRQLFSDNLDMKSCYDLVSSLAETAFINLKNAHF